MGPYIVVREGLIMNRGDLNVEQQTVYHQVKSWGRTFNLDNREKIYFLKLNNEKLSNSALAQELLEACD